MKKIFIVSMVLTVLLIFAACGDPTELSGAKDSSEKPANYMEVGRLSSQEEYLNWLLGDNKTQLIFDFIFDGTVKTMKIATHELGDGGWHERVSRIEPFDYDKVRFIFRFDKIMTGYNLATITDDRFMTTSYAQDLDYDLSGLGCGRTTPLGLREIEWDREITLVMEQFYPLNSAYSRVPIRFNNLDDCPEKEEPTLVHKLTIMFSQKTIEEFLHTTEQDLGQGID